MLWPEIYNYGVLAGRIYNKNPISLTTIFVFPDILTLPRSCLLRCKTRPSVGQKCCQVLFQLLGPFKSREMPSLVHMSFGSNHSNIRRTYLRVLVEVYQVPGLLNPRLRNGHQLLREVREPQGFV